MLRAACPVRAREEKPRGARRGMRTRRGWQRPIRHPDGSGGTLERDKRLARLGFPYRSLDPGTVCRVSDPAQRNRLITRSYQELSLAMRDILGADAGINWCTLAGWASGRAGQTIRQEDCPPFLAGLIRLLTLGDLDPERAREAVAEGNLGVYQEIAPPFARFIDWFGADRRPASARLEAFLEGVQGAEVRDQATGWSGRELLRAAFRNYYRARCLAESRPAEVRQRQEYTFLANVQVALHEQNHLQDAIVRALPRAGWLRRQVTAWFLDLPMPGGGRISLARDVPGREYTRHLQRIDDPEARRVLRSFGVGESPRGSACADWADLRQRMRFIITLLRVQQDNPTLFTLPEEGSVLQPKVG